MNDLPPHNIEAEQQLLGAMFSNNANLDRVSGDLKAEHFFESLHADIYTEMLADQMRGRQFSPVTMRARFEEDSRISEMGGIGYLARLLGASVSAAYCADYAAIIIDMAGKRKIQEAMREASEGISAGKETPELIKGLDAKLSSVTTGGVKNSLSITKAMTEALSALYDQSEGVSTGGVTTGRQALNERLGGFFNQDFIVLGGRPSMGKTALATSICLSVARSGRPVAFVSAEMGSTPLVHRFWSEMSGVPYFGMRQPASLTEGEVRQITQAASELADMPIEIVPDDVLDINAIRAACHRIRREFGDLGLVVVDYMQLLNGDGKFQQERIANISRGLKQMAKSLDCPVIALSQLSRGVEDRDNKRPLLSDLRDSGQIEQDADVVLFCYRDHYYLSKQKPTGIEKRVDWESDCSRTRNEMEVITAKQRMGPTGSDTIGCDIGINRFWDITGEGQRDEEFDF